MSDQAKMYFRSDKLEEFLFGSDRHACEFALREMQILLNSQEKNAPEIHAIAFEMMFGRENLGKTKALMTSHEYPRVQAEAMHFVSAALMHMGKQDAPDFLSEAVETALKSKSCAAGSIALGMVEGYLKDDMKRGRVMDVLASEMILGLQKGMCANCRNIATLALQYPDVRDRAIETLAGVLMNKDANPPDRQCALRTIELLFNKGTDISRAERGLCAVAKDRDDLLFRETRALLANAERLRFNVPGARLFEKPSTQRISVPAQKLERAVAAA